MPEKDIYEKFIDKLFSLDAADRTALKRNAGKLMQDADTTAIIAFYRAAPHGVKPYETAVWFAVACMACLQKERTQGLPFEICLSMVGDSSKSLTKKVIVLLDSDWDACMIQKLYRLAKIIDLNNLNIDYRSLLGDLLRWRNPNRVIQKKWARRYSEKQQNDESGDKANAD